MVTPRPAKTRVLVKGYARSTRASVAYKEYIMEELIANLEEDIDLLVYDSQPTDIEKKIASDLVEVIIYLKKQM